MKIIGLVTSCVFIFGLFSCENNQELSVDSATENREVTIETKVIESIGTTKYSVSVYEVNNNEFGYDVLMNGKPYIHQPHMPAIGGNSGFSSKEKAEQAGNFVIQKLMNNIIPPTISVNELDSLGLLE